MNPKAVKITVVMRGGDPLYIITGGGMKKVYARTGKTAEEVAGARARVIAKHWVRRKAIAVGKQRFKV